VFTQPAEVSWLDYDPLQDSYIAASYIKYLEMSGARVVPIPWNTTEHQLEEHFARVNGLLFPGGVTNIFMDPKSGNKWTESATYLIKKAIQENQKGNHFPVWGTCLGFELLHYVIAEYREVISDVGEDYHVCHTVQKTGISKLISTMNHDLLEALERKDAMYYWHHQGVLPSTVLEDPALRNFFKVVGTSKSNANITFVAAVEGKTLPFYGTQFHPEKSSFEWKAEANHNLYAVRLE